jgi:hypothetical protein
LFIAARVVCSRDHARGNRQRVMARLTPEARMNAQDGRTDG